MPLVMPNVGEKDALEISLGKTAVEGLVLKLFTNNYNPVPGSTAGDFTEATGGGYGAVALNGSNWSVTAGEPTQGVYPEVSFVFTGNIGNVFGYYLVGATSGRIRYAERFSDGPYNIQNSGDQIKVTPQITLQSIN
jgi:hypothetical protein